MKAEFSRCQFELALELCLMDLFRDSVPPAPFSNECQKQHGALRLVSFLILVNVVNSMGFCAYFFWDPNERHIQFPITNHKLK